MGGIHLRFLVSACTCLLAVGLVFTAIAPRSETYTYESEEGYPTDALSFASEGILTSDDPLSLPEPPPEEEDGDKRISPTGSVLGASVVGASRSSIPTTAAPQPLTLVQHVQKVQTGPGLTVKKGKVRCESASDDTFGCISGNDFENFSDKVDGDDLEDSEALANLIGDGTGTGALVFGDRATMSALTVSGLSVTDLTLTDVASSSLLATNENKEVVATTSVSLTGVITDTLQVLGTATTSLQHGVNLASGCFAIGGICVAGGPSGGIVGLNGLTNVVQTFASSSSGTDFSITSSGSTHTFTFPSASPSSRGLLTSTDWSMFNEKISSTSLDTITELETHLGGTNLIVSTEIDTLAELETLMSGINILAATEVDTSSELAAILGDETGTGNVVFSASPTFTGTANFVNASATSWSAGAAYIGQSGTTTLTANGYVITNRIGIGSTSPSARLSIHDSSGGAGNNPLFVIATSSASGTGTTTVFTVLGNGSVGVNTGTPVAKLSVSSANLSQAWLQVGTNTSLASVVSALATLSPKHVAFIDSNSESLETYEWNGSAWAQVGAGLSVSGISTPSLGALSPNMVVLADGTTNELRTYEWNGSTWSQIGVGTNAGDMGDSGIAVLSSRQIALVDDTVGTLRTYGWNGNSWNQEGSSLSISGIVDPALTTLSQDVVAYIDDANDLLRVYQWNGSAWRQIGNSLSVPISDPRSATLSPNRIVLNSTSGLTTYDWDGNNWHRIGDSLASGFGAVTALSPSRVAVAYALSTDELRTYQFSNPLFFVGNTQDYPYFAISDNGFTTVEGLDIRTHLIVGSGATSTSGTTTPSFVVNGVSTFSGFVGIGTTSPSGGSCTTSTCRLSVSGIGDEKLIVNTSSSTVGAALMVQNSGVSGMPRFEWQITGSTSGATTRFRLNNIDSGGAIADIISIPHDSTSVGFGSTSPSTRLTVQTSGVDAARFNVTSISSDTILTLDSSDGVISSGSYFLEGYDGSTQSFAFRGDGQLLLPLAGTESGSDNYVCIDAATGLISDGGANCGASSLRYKENIQDIGYGLAAILAVRPVSFEWKEEERPSDDGTYLGFIAEEMYEVIPEVVELKDGIIESIDYDKLTAVLAKAIQELAAKLDALALLVSTERVETHTLCVGDTCVTEEEFRALLSEEHISPTPQHTDETDSVEEPNGPDTATTTPEATDSNAEGGADDVTLEESTSDEAPFPETVTTDGDESIEEIAPTHIES